MPLLTVEQMRKHVETGLDDEALEGVIAGAEAEIESRFGPLGSADVVLAGMRRYITAPRAIATVTRVTESVNGQETVLSANDYCAWHRYRIERLATGDNPRREWGTAVRLEYEPVDDSAERATLLISLVKLDLAYQGLRRMSVGSGDYQIEHVDYIRERARLLSALQPRTMVIA